jgi:hypothetical protein
MAGIAIFSVSLASLLALRPNRVIDDPGVGVLTLLLALILTIGADRALFGRKSRAFWIGFTATGWLCAAVTLINLHEARGFVLKYGPPVVRARQIFVQQHIAAREAEMRGVYLATPQVSEWYLLGSLLTETGLGLALGVLAASSGGLLAVSMALIGRRARLLARGSAPPNDTIQRIEVAPDPNAPPEPRPEPEDARQDVSACPSPLSGREK